MPGFFYSLDSWVQNQDFLDNILFQSKIDIYLIKNSLHF